MKNTINVANTNLQLTCNVHMYVIITLFDMHILPADTHNCRLPRLKLTDKIQPNHTVITTSGIMQL